MKKSVTAMDVAKKAGVSQSSVSRVYFKGASVSEKTRKKVLKAAEELGYRPNEFARGLITNRSKMIGLVMKGVQNPFYPQVLKLFTTSLKEQGYHILFVYTNNDEIQQSDIDVLLNYNVEGVIITDATMSMQATEDFKRSKVPLVFFNRKVINQNFHTVCCNNLKAGKEIARFLLQKGNRRMLYISGNENTSTSLEREKGFSEVLSEQGLTYEKYVSDYTYEGGYETTCKILTGDERPEAIFAANDIMALGVLDALQKYSLTPGVDMDVIGFDNIDMAAWPHYRLTTWEQPIDEMVRQTVSYLMEEIEEYTGVARNIEVNGKLIQRETS